MSGTITITQSARLTRATNGVREVDIDLMSDFLDGRGVPSSDPRPSNPYTSDDVADDVMEEDNGANR